MGFGVWGAPAASQALTSSICASTVHITLALNIGSSTALCNRGGCAVDMNEAEEELEEELVCRSARDRTRLS